MATYVLVPGAWLGGWAWDEVATRLRDRGHEVHALTLSSLGERAGDGTEQVGTYTQAISLANPERTTRPHVLVSCSFRSTRSGR